MKNNKAVRLMLVLAAGVLTFMALRLYFNVEGRQISSLLVPVDGGRVQLSKTYESSTSPQPLYEGTLEAAQLEELLALVEGTRFKRITSSSVAFQDKERYLITAEDKNGRIYFRLESYGGEFILVDAARGDAGPKHWKLRIQNDGWKDALEEIIALSPQ